MSKNNDKINTDNISQELSNLEAQLSQINPAIDDLVERIKRPKDELDEIVGRLSNDCQNQYVFPSFLKELSKIIPLYFPLLVFIAILIGSFKSRFYLDNIGYSSIFSEIIGNPSALIGIVVAYSLLVFTLAFHFAIPFFNFLILNHSNLFFKNEEFNKKNIKIIKKDIKLSIPRILFKNLLLYSLVPLFLIARVLCIYFDFDFEKDVLCIGFVYCFLLPVYFSFKCKKLPDGILIYFILSSIFVYSYIYPILYIKIIISFESRENWQWYILLAVIAIPILVNIFSFIVLKSQKNIESKKIDDVFMGVMSALILLAFSFILTIATPFSDLSLYAPRFIERPTNSSWYLIHNGNTTSENINGLSKRDILVQKDIFNAKDCTTLKNKDGKKKCQDDNKDIFNNRDNALYGYMAWNLGNTKVFCPVSVDFFDDKGNNTEKSEKCLVIDGKYLQLVSEYYLKQPTES